MNPSDTPVVSLTREELYRRVWSTPLRRLAPHFGLSDVGLRKLCDRHHIPTPPRGYWAKQGFGKAPVFNREGGSIPVVSTFQQELGLPSVLFGIGLPDENAHAPDEKLDLSNFHNGIIASAYLYQEIANLNGS